MCLSVRPVDTLSILLPTMSKGSDLSFSLDAGELLPAYTPGTLIRLVAADWLISSSQSCNEW